MRGDRVLELNPIRPVPPMARDMDLQKNRLASTRSLAGETIILRHDDGAVAALRLTAQRVSWQIEDLAGTRGGEIPYDAVELRQQIYFLHFASAEAGFGVSQLITARGGAASVPGTR
jgi:hypothetical protein